MLWLGRPELDRADNFNRYRLSAGLANGGKLRPLNYDIKLIAPRPLLDMCDTATRREMKKLGQQT